MTNPSFLITLVTRTEVERRLQIINLPIRHMVGERYIEHIIQTHIAHASSLKIVNNVVVDSRNVPIVDMIIGAIFNKLIEIGANELPF